MPEVDWTRTSHSESRLEHKEALEIKNGEKYYKGRPIIHRDSPINGGVYVGENAREAIVVDYDKYSGLVKCYADAKKRESKDEILILKAVFDTVVKAMPAHDKDSIEAIIKKYGAEADHKISLDVFIKEGIGNCRHCALACAAILEQFEKDRYIKGKISVDRNTMAHERGHAWCRYTSSDGEVYILDVTQGYFGKLSGAENKYVWAYRRPEDS